MAVSTEQLRRMLNADEPDYAGLARLGGGILPQLAQLLNDRSEDTAANAASLAGMIGSDQAVALLERAARSRSGQVRSAAASALRGKSGPKAAALVATLLRDSDKDVRKFAGKAAPTRSGSAVAARAAEIQPETFEFPSADETEVIGPEDTRRCVTNTAALPFRFICNLEVGGGGCCTGTLIGPRTVITAGHCLVDRCMQPGLAPSAMRVIPARNAAGSPAEPFGSTPAAAIQLAKSFVIGTATDYGVAILRDPVGNSSGWWTFDFTKAAGDPIGTSIVGNDESIPNAGVQVDVSGYPCDLPARTHKGGAPDRCFKPSLKKGTVQYHDRNGLANVTPDGLLEYFNDTFNCMSGSPVWVQNDASHGGRMMVAVHISGNAPPDPPVANRGVLITGTVRSFIQAHSFSPPGTIPPGRPLVRFGARGVTVEELQYRLNIWILTTPSSGQPRLVVDGIFGQRTLAATRAFQRAMALAVDGVVGPQTWRRLQLPF